MWNKITCRCPNFKNWIIICRVFVYNMSLSRFIHELVCIILQHYINAIIEVVWWVFPDKYLQKIKSMYIFYGMFCMIFLSLLFFIAVVILWYRCFISVLLFRGGGRVLPNSVIIIDTRFIAVVSVLLLKFSAIYPDLTVFNGINHT